MTSGLPQGTPWDFLRGFPPASFWSGCYKQTWRQRNQWFLCKRYLNLFLWSNSPLTNFFWSNNNHGYVQNIWSKIYCCIKILSEVEADESYRRLRLIAPYIHHHHLCVCVCVCGAGAGAVRVWFAISPKGLWRKLDTTDMSFHKNTGTATCQV